MVSLANHHMRIVFYYCMFLLWFRDVSGQTLTCQTNCPQAGEVFSMKTASPVIASAGANQLWNFGMVPGMSGGTHLIAYNPPGSTPASSLYPQANLVRSKSGVNTFLFSDNTGVRVLSSTSTTVNTPPMELPLPFKFGDTYSETVASTSISATDTFVTTWQNSFDAYGAGTLILPSGTYPDVLAIKYTGTMTVTKNGNNTGEMVNNTSYYMYSPNISQWLVYSRSLTGTGPIDHAPYTEILDQVVVGLEERTKDDANDWSVSPNPTRDFVNVKLNHVLPGMIVVRNTLGQQVLDVECREGHCTLNLSDFPEGVYTVSLVNGAFVANKKLVVGR